jgi:hypothetical protein
MRSCSGELRIEGLAGECRLEGRQERSALLSQGAEMAPDSAERLRVAGRAEGSRDFLLHLAHAQVALGLVVVEGDRGALEEGEHLLPPEPQPLQRVPRGRLLDAARRCGPRWGGVLAANPAAKMPS